eukprot:754835-Hanusia_phi.AAC.3
MESRIQLPMITHIAKLNATCIFLKKMKNLNVHWGFDLQAAGDICKVKHHGEISMTMRGDENRCDEDRVDILSCTHTPGCSTVIEGSQLIGFLDGEVARVVCRLIPSTTHKKFCRARLFPLQSLRESQEQQGDDEETTEMWKCEIRISGDDSARTRSIKLLRQSNVSFSTLSLSDNPSPSIVINRTAAVVQNSQEALEGIIDDLQNLTSCFNISLVEMETLKAKGLRSHLYDYQLRGINWLLSRECRMEEAEGQSPDGRMAAIALEDEDKSEEEEVTDVDDRAVPHNQTNSSIMNVSTLEPQDNLSSSKAMDELVHSALWKRVTSEDGTSCYDSVIANTRRFSKPQPVFGGILADDMGLGECSVAGCWFQG